VFLQDWKLRDRQTIEYEVAEIFSQKLHLDVSSFDSDLFETGILDSLQLVELLFQLEQQFGVCISLDETDIEDFRSIKRISLMLAGQNGNGQGLNPRGLDFPKVAETEK
jgi:D-alanine--poly(phosphoribitol) ligase subunit 2